MTNVDNSVSETEMSESETIREKLYLHNIDSPIEGLSEAYQKQIGAEERFEMRSDLRYIHKITVWH